MRLDPLNYWSTRLPLWKWSDFQVKWFGIDYQTFNFGTNTSGNRFFFPNSFLVKMASSRLTFCPCAAKSSKVIELEEIIWRLFVRLIVEGSQSHFFSRRFKTQSIANSVLWISLGRRNNMISSLASFDRSTNSCHNSNGFQR